MNITTTIKIYKDDLSWWKDCCKKFKMSSQNVFSELKRKVQLKQQHEFFLKFAFPSDYHKPLENIKIDKKYTKNGYII